MTSSKPYLLRALYEWILDNDLTPHVIVDIHADDVVVPEQAAQDGRLVLNVSPMATRNLELGNDAITFQARFAGVSQQVYVPLDAVLAIYARENGQGMMFSGTEDEGEDPPTPDTPPDKPDKPDKPQGPKLRVIK